MSIEQPEKITRNFFLGFIRLHILYHAAKEPVFGLDMIRELGRHGYNLSPGTLYPILHQLEADGFLLSNKEVVNGRVRKYYQATEAGKRTLADARAKMHELMSEAYGNPE